MSKLAGIEWDKGFGLENAVVLGIRPSLALADAARSRLEAYGEEADKEEYVTHLLFLLEDLLLELEKKLVEFFGQVQSNCTAGRQRR